MYADPLRLRGLHFVTDNNSALVIDIMKLVRLLLLSLPDGGQVTELLRAAYLQDPADYEQGQEPGQEQCQDNEQEHQLTTVKKSSGILYASFITTINFEDHVHPSQGIFHNKHISSNVHFNEYLRQSGRTVRYLIEEAPNQAANATQDSILAFAAARDLRKDLTRALCGNPGRLRTLVIPISDVTHYLAQVDRLKVLTYVKFLMDRCLTPWAHRSKVLTEAEQQVVELQQTERIERLEEMVLFVQEHRRLYPNMLSMARHIPFNSNEVNCPMSYQLRILRSLPVLSCPRSLDHANWPRFVANFQDTNLLSVKTIQLPHNAITWRVTGRFVAEGPFIHRCRGLESMNMGLLAEDAFQWAVDERKQYRIDVAAGRTPQRPLVPLSIFTTRYGRPTTGRQLNDVLFSFNETLTSITISAYWSPFNHINAPTTVSIGESDTYWELPRLSKLSVEVKRAYVCVQRDFLARCPGLSIVIIVDKRASYRLDEIVYWRPAELGRLQIFKLRGTPALSFHPETLRRTPSLVHLDLGVAPNGDRSGDCLFIPPLEELAAFDDSNSNNSNSINSNRSDNTASTLPLPTRPIWTWDWELPKLSELRLRGEFAYRFQFRMLEGTPNLESLYLSIKTSMEQHKRTISLSDLLKSRSTPQQQQRQQQKLSASDSNNYSSGEQEYMSLPGLKELKLLGPWTLQEGFQVLTVLFSQVAPKIQGVSMDGCDGFSAKEWVKSTSRHLQGLHRAVCSLPRVPEQLAEAGLVPLPGADTGLHEYQLKDQPEGLFFVNPVIYQF
ncbi:hypothetical protein BGW39_008013 [Mortierella sp. 14UC]|nr:hypothetical protein BGW39_008013 [Mortierella sp. 14UC]